MQRPGPHRLQKGKDVFQPQGKVSESGSCAGGWNLIQGVTKAAGPQLLKRRRQSDMDSSVSCKRETSGENTKSLQPLLGRSSIYPSIQWPIDHRAGGQNHLQNPKQTSSAIDKKCLEKNISDRKPLPNIRRSPAHTFFLSFLKFISTALLDVCQRGLSLAGLDLPHSEERATLRAAATHGADAASRDVECECTWRGPGANERGMREDV